MLPILSIRDNPGAHTTEVTEFLLAAGVQALFVAFDGARPGDR